MRIVTSGERDAKIQAHVRRLSDERRAAGKFAGGILFWDDLMESLTASPAEFAKHYPQLAPSATTSTTSIDGATRERLLKLAGAKKRECEYFLAETRKHGGASSRNRPMWIQNARAAAEACAKYYRAGGDEISAIEWEQAAKSVA